MWLLFVPLLILLVILLSVGALTAGVIGLAGSHWPWLLIAAGIWLFWHEDGRHRRAHRRDWPTSMPRGVSPASKKRGYDDRQPSKRTDSTAKTGPAPVTPIRRAELPIDVQVKVEQIRRKVEVLLSYADRFPPFSKDLYLVRQTASEYLPRTINSYLALAPQTTDRPMPGSGPTPHQELKAQLDLLDAKLDEIAQDLQRQDVDRLLANRRFLEERFGRASA
jgi:hypothetical protein